MSKAGWGYSPHEESINIDTVSAAGDGDFLAALLASEQFKARYPNICDTQEKLFASSFQL